MSNTNETIPEIVEEMRIFKCRNLETGELKLCSAIANYFADRIEAAAKREDSAWRSAVLDFCDGFTMVYEPPFNDCPALLAGAFEVMCDELGIEQVKIGGAK